MLEDFWRSFSNAAPWLSSKLLLGSVGAEHLAGMVSDKRALAGGTPQILATARDILLAAWEEAPLDAKLAQRLLDQETKTAFLPQGRAQLLRAVVAAWKLPNDTKYLERQVSQRAFAKLKNYLPQQVKRDPGNLFWLAQILTVGEILGEYAWVEEFLAGRHAAIPELAPVWALLQGNMRFLLDDYEGAAQRYAEALQGAPELWLASERRAEALFRLGDKAGAVCGWREALQARPWHVNVILRAHAALAGPALSQTPPPGKTAALLYTYNKAEALDQALNCLAQSTGWEQVVVLNNASTDHTEDVLTAWRERLGARRMRIESLPVNIGAPAARNWLAGMDALADCDYVAYLDDDALPPPNWLPLLEHARKQHPAASAWGCRIVDAGAGRRIQCADSQLALGCDPDDAECWEREFDLTRAYAKPFELTELWAQVSDFGQFSYTRPCLSVSGCCHLVERASLQPGAGGGFMLHFTPTQLDDVERDLRLARQGRRPCYQGLLPVRHLKESGRTARRDRAAFGNWLANRYKLLHRFDREALLALQGAMEQALGDDVMKKIPEVQELLDLRGEKTA